MTTPPSRRTEAAIALTIGLLAFAIGSWYARMPAVTAAASYYQETMGPAVMFACGHGLISAGRTPPPALDAFLSREVDSFDCRERASVPEPMPLTALQSASRYLLLGVGLAWFAGGVSWSGLWWMFGLLYATTSVCLYLAARFVLNRPLAIALALLLMTSTMQLGALPHLRDYSKAPFFCAMLLMVLAVLTRPMPARALLTWAATAGAVMGLAVGVRFDITLLLGVFAGAVMFGAPGAIRDQWRVRVAAVTVSAVAFLLVGLPVLTSFALGNNSWHVILLGFAEPHQAALGLHPTPYHIGTLYNDSFIAAAVNSSWQRTHGSTELLPLDTPEYATASGEYFRQIAALFPADLLTRAWAATAGVFALPFEGSLALPTFVTTEQWLGRLLSARAVVMAWLHWLAPWAAVVPAAVLLLTARVHLKGAVVGTVACLFLFGVSSLQFQGRHIFHLEVLPFLLLAIGVQAAVSMARRRHLSSDPSRYSWRVVGALTVMLLLLMAGPVWALRQYQQTRVQQLFERYARAVRNEPAVSSTLDATRTLLSLPLFTEPLSSPLQSQFLVADFGGEGCDYDEVQGMIRYRSSEGAADFSRPFVVRIPTPPELARLWFAVYEFHDARAGRDYRFAGLELPTARAACVTQLGRIADIGEFPLMVDATQDGNWSSTPLFARFRAFETPSVVYPKTYAFPPDAVFTRSELSRKLTPLPTAEYVASVATIKERRIAVQGIASPAGYLVSWPAGPLPPSRVLIAEGELRSGGFVVGLERNNTWAAQVPVTTRGPFRIAIRVPEDGEYRPVIANNRAGGALWTSLTIERIGWVE